MLYRKNENLLMYEQDNKGIAQMLDGTLHILNSTALEIYSICDGRTEQEIIDIIKLNYENIDHEVIHTDVEEILKLMVDKGIIDLIIED